MKTQKLAKWVGSPLGDSTGESPGSERVKSELSQVQQGNQFFSQENWVDGVVRKVWGEAVLTGEGARLGFWKRKPKGGLPHPLPAWL